MQPSTKAEPTFVDFWNVGLNSPTDLEFSAEVMSAHLISDWCPRLPVALGSSFMGWPAYLLEAREIFSRKFLNVRRLLTVSEQAGTSERQWKGTLSWMAGVAGARHFLAQENYRWVAPISAFYSNAVQPVATQRWNFPFPQPKILTMSPSDSSVRLTPDYVAVRSSTNASTAIEWAVVEAKGTYINVASRASCPVSWSQQARNIEITVDERTIPVPRNIVVATRVNPNARRPMSRVIQIRAWNRNHIEAESSRLSEAIPEIVSAHLFGLFRNLHLHENAIAIAVAAEARSYEHDNQAHEQWMDKIGRARDRADTELKSRGEQQMSGEREYAIRVRYSGGSAVVLLSEPLQRLYRQLQAAATQESARAFIRDSDHALDVWARQKTIRDTPHRVALPFGVTVDFSISENDQR